MWLRFNFSNLLLFTSDLSWSEILLVVAWFLQNNFSKANPRFLKSRFHILVDLRIFSQCGYRFCKFIHVEIFVDGFCSYWVTLLVIHANLVETIKTTRRTSYDTEDVSCILVNANLAFWFLLPHKNPDSRHSVSGTVTCRNIVCISAVKLYWCSRKSKKVPTNFCCKYAPVKSFLFSDSPLFLAAALHIRLTFSNFSGLITR